MEVIKGGAFRLWMGRESWGSPYWALDGLAIISHKLDPLVDAERLVGKVRFLSFDLLHRLEGSSETDKLISLKNHFFGHFQCSPVYRGERDFLLHHVLSGRQGSPLLLGALLQAFAQMAQLNSGLVVHGSSLWLKFVHNGRRQFLDLAGGGHIVPKAQLLEKMHDPSEGELLESLTGEQMLLQVLTQLRRFYQRTHMEDRLLCTLNLIVELQPSNLGALADRALLKEKLGEPYSALQDLKRYFTFYGEDQGCPKVIAAYHRLAARFQKAPRPFIPLR